MLLFNTKQSYGWVSIIMHWLMAVVILSMFALGIWMVELSYYDRWYHDAPYIHKAAGMILLFLLLFRMFWRTVNIRPLLMGQGWEKVVALSVHRLHYLLLLFLVGSGYLIPTAQGVGIDILGWFSVPAIVTLDKGGVDLAGLIHQYTAWAVIILAGLHAAAAFKHHFIDKDITLLRMLGITRP